MLTYRITWNPTTSNNEMVVWCRAKTITSARKELALMVEKKAGHWNSEEHAPRIEKYRSRFDPQSLRGSRHAALAHP